MGSIDAPARTQRTTKHRFFAIEMLPAEDGDSLWLEYGDAQGVTAVLIDGGRQSAVSSIRQRLTEVSKPLALLVLSHVDADHLEGAITLLCDPTSPLKMEQVWYNGFHHLADVALQDDPDLRMRGGGAAGLVLDDYPRGPEQGEYVSALLKELGLADRWNRDDAGKAVCISESGPLPVRTLKSGLRLTLLSPSPKTLARMRSTWVRTLAAKGLTPDDHQTFWARLAELEGDQMRSPQKRTLLDSSVANGSSIAFLAEYGGVGALMLADAHAPQLEESLRRLLSIRDLPRLRADILKLSHHGSRGNMTAELAAMIDVEHVLISTSGAKHGHPDAETFTCLMASNPSRTMTFHFNYESGCRPEIEQLILQSGHRVNCGVAGICRLTLHC